ncbi:HalOD1 output domain-containing protein [Halobacterium zhouii]|uniref:HalOD1 output domain-containing protein n=1 Tax=Halobacterium zhouii TaxID=2902624 RepID=UPI001E3087E6|nr:HalOD1 output domain-containing protein [Halobacterium zhouii]
MEYYGQPETHRFKFDQGGTPPSLAVVASLSEVTERDPIDIEPLNTAVDPDALDSLLHFDDTPDEGVSVSFTLEAYTVAVYSDGVVEITPPGFDRLDGPDGGGRHE